MDSFSNNVLETEQPLVVALESNKESLGINFVIKVTNHQTVILRIRDRSRNIVFQKHFHGSKAYRGILNLENLGNGKYYLEVRHSGQKFSQKLNLHKYSLRTVRLD
jgi:hypothetical protein